MLPDIKILLVDDEIDFVETTCKRLLRRGLDARFALSCGAGMESIEAGWPDVVVLDVMLPDRSGLDCLKEIKEKRPLLPVVLLTGHASIEAGLHGLECGASDYCLKPIELDILLEKIAIAYRESRPRQA